MDLTKYFPESYSKLDYVRYQHGVEFLGQIISIIELYTSVEKKTRLSKVDCVETSSGPDYHYIFLIKPIINLEKNTSLNTTETEIIHHNKVIEKISYEEISLFLLKSD